MFVKFIPSLLPDFYLNFKKRIVFLIATCLDFKLLIVLPILVLIPILFLSMPFFLGWIFLLISLLFIIDLPYFMHDLIPPEWRSSIHWFALTFQITSAFFLTSSIVIANDVMRLKTWDSPMDRVQYYDCRGYEWMNTWYCRVRKQIAPSTSTIGPAVNRDTNKLQIEK